MVTRLLVLLQMLFDEGGFAHAFGTYDCNELRTPMDLIHLVPDDVHAGIGQQPVTLSK